MSGAGHEPVLLRESIEALNIRPDGIYIDGTLGRAGHSLEIARRLTTGLLIGIDRDGSAIQAAKERLKDYAARTVLIKSNFDRIDSVLDGLGIEAADGMLFDLGVSSPQLDEADRGFSYTAQAPLDMRMDRSETLTAYEIANDWDADKIKDILFRYGEERWSARIAAAIVRYREKKPIETTTELAGIIKSAMPASALKEKQHPAKRSFQALRIAVNDELGSIERMLDAAPDRLASGGRLCVISFHSLEDRLVKQAIRKRENGCTCPKDFPVCVCGFRQTLRQVGAVVTPGRDELERNPRSRSAKLRTAEKI
ncbi:MAG: 16S rRNA (cytosine(1402)-N(4))-methyltransferase RsmH [Oscillospiraceae bacterium]|nr:16S rRNA (cytosine(1402)-N(4))-methyltransferase RsmH [Oscillospiraceae bacterium]